MTHAGEEFIHVLEGRTRYHVGETSNILGLGDSLYFDAAQEHDLEPLSPKVVYLGIFSEKSIS